MLCFLASPDAVNTLKFYLIKLCVSEQIAANKKVTDLEKEIQTLKSEVKTLTEEKIEQSSGN